LAHIALTAYELENGGISRVAVYLANGFAQAGHQVSFVVCTSSGALDSNFRGELDAAVHYIALNERPFASRAIGQILSFRGFRRWLLNAKPDIILGTANNISWFAGLGKCAIRRTGAQLFIKTTNPIIREKDGAFVTAIRRLGYDRLFASASSVLTLSDAESSILEREFPDRRGVFRAVFNPYLTDAFLARPVDKECRKERRLRVLAIGRLTPQKNMSRLIEAFVLSCEISLASGDKSLANAQLIIAGEGPEFAALKMQAEKTKVAKQIKFIGFCHNIAEELSHADLFVLSSNYEGLPAVVIEALGSGCPVVSTNCFPAAEELLNDLPGCAVTDRTSVALAHGIIAAVGSSPRPDKLRARALDYTIGSAIHSHLSAMDI
jgi:glycosyltransferase involved in cell wall biosynthesis